MRSAPTFVRKKNIHYKKVTLEGVPSGNKIGMSPLVV
jgi:hypothetical protein